MVDLQLAFECIHISCTLGCEEIALDSAECLVDIVLCIADEEVNDKAQSHKHAQDQEIERDEDEEEGEFDDAIALEAEEELLCIDSNHCWDDDSERRVVVFICEDEEREVHHQRCQSNHPRDYRKRQLGFVNT